jgi:predicted Zn-dependent peptidase
VKEDLEKIKEVLLEVVRDINEDKEKYAMYTLGYLVCQIKEKIKYYEEEK